ncbi:hypothetical protein BH20VER1_BH20VER1_29060 [soil metagenome]
MLRVMSDTIDALSRSALALTPIERLALAHRLLESVELDPDPGADAAWEAEIARRMADFDEGRTQGVPAEEVFARLREIAPGR